jgi:hypothetical protein
VILETNWNKVALLLVAIFWTAFAFAQGGPPMRTDDPGTPGNGNIEVNIALGSERAAGEQFFEAPVLDINYGAGDRIQLNYQVAYELRSTDEQRTQSGLGNSSAAVKWRFYENKTLELQVSTYPRIDFNNPTSSVRRGLADRGMRFLLPIELTKKIGPIEANVEGGYAFKESGADEYIAGLAIGREINKKLEVMGEWYSTGAVDGAERDMSVGAGTRYRLGEHAILIIMAARGVGRHGVDQPHFIGYGGVQFSFASRYNPKANEKPNK